MFAKGLSARPSFRLKIAAAVALVALADLLFLFHRAGAVVGAFALAWLALLLAVRPGLVRDPRALAMLAAAAALALVMIDRPGVLAWCLFGLSLTVAVLSVRVKRGEPVWRWSQRLIVHGVVAAAGPVIDARRIARHARPVRMKVSIWSWVRLLVPPMGGGLVFLALFASANPLIADVLDRLRTPALPEDAPARAVCWIVVLLMAGATLRPRWRGRLVALPSFRPAARPGAWGASITLSLIVFNLLFAVQNGLDLAFLWSGAPLPDDMTLAEYAHRGAYPLIVTALLAGLFVLVALRPGSETARRPLVRGLVVLWVGQNMLLVASSLLRTADYIEAYALTRFRIAAMIWMVLVGLGLLLICWRMLAGKDGHWLIDANVKLLLVVLAAVSVVDLGAVTAAWNVRHAREIDGTGAALDLGYLRTLGSSAAVSLVELEQAAGDDPALAARIAWVRADVVADMRRNQARWRSWTWRDARRLQAVDALAARRPLLRAVGPREWNGDPVLTPPPLVVPVAPVPAPVIVPDTTSVQPLTSTPGV